jgi:hypothetical protein
VLGEHLIFKSIPPRKKAGYYITLEERRPYKSERYIKNLP